MWTEARLSTTSGAVESINEEVAQQRKMGQDEMKNIVDEFLLKD